MTLKRASPQALPYATKKGRWPVATWINPNNNRSESPAPQVTFSTNVIYFYEIEKYYLVP
jgi:hypothetical protein